MSFRRDPSAKFTRMREFFEANPHEELTLAEIQTKFDLKLKTTQVYVQRLGLQRFSVYRKPSK